MNKEERIKSLEGKVQQLEEKIGNESITYYFSGKMVKPHGIMARFKRLEEFLGIEDTYVSEKREYRKISKTKN